MQRPQGQNALLPGYFSQHSHGTQRETYFIKGFDRTLCYECASGSFWVQCPPESLALNKYE